MTRKFECNNCKEIIKGKWRSTPNRGDYIRCLCDCGNKESSRYEHGKGWYWFDNFKEKVDSIPES